MLFLQILAVSLYLFIATSREQTIDGAPTRDQQVPDLQHLSVKSLVRRYSIFREVEEIYDQSRGLGKLSVQMVDGQKRELYTRIQENVYVEVEYNLDGSVANCQASQVRPSGGFFGLFNSMVGLAQEKDKSRQLGYLIGPAALIYAYRAELVKASASPSDSSESPSKKQDVDLELNDRMRIFLKQNPIEFPVPLGNGVSRERVVFMQTDLFVDRCPLLTKLAPFVAYTNQNGNLFLIDYLAIDTYEPFALTHQDPFKLPVGHLCFPDQTNPKGSLFHMEAGWAEKLPLNLDDIRASVRSSSSSNSGLNIAIDMNRHILRLDIMGKSRNFFDIANNLIYHLPNEPAPKADLEVDALDGDDVNKNRSIVRNLECTIVHNEIFNSGGEYRTYTVKEQNSRQRWKYLVGETDSIMYLGKTRYRNKFAHEFELSYAKLTEMPFFFMLLVSKETWTNLEPSESSRLIATLWITADESCPELYSLFSSCPDPSLLGFKVNLINRDDFKQVAGDKEIQFLEFLWESREEGLLDKVSNLYEIQDCPLNKLRLKFNVHWMQTDLEQNSAPDLDVEQSLDDYIAKSLIDLMHTFADSKISLISLDSRSFPGTNNVEYSMQLVEHPREAIGFQLVSSHANQVAFKHSIIDHIDSATLFECLTWASQFGNAISVVYPSKGSCFLYKEDLSQSTEANQKDSSDLLFKRKLDKLIDESRSQENKPYGIEHFTRTTVKEINQVLEKGCQKSNEVQVRINSRETAKDVRIGRLELITTREELSSSTNRYSSSLMILSGYRFKGVDGGENPIRSRANVEVTSFAYCLRRCEEEPMCKSFSFCRYPETHHEFCQLSDMMFNFNLDQHDERKLAKELKMSLNRDSNCEIHAKDYLFYYNSMNANEISSEDSYRLLPVPEVETSQQCAAQCFHSDPDLCLRFLYCPTSEINSVCYQWSSRETNKDPTHPKEDRSLKGCLAYQRKPLTLYARILSMNTSSWIVSSEDGLAQETIPNLNEEQCAEKCSDDVECVSFDTCLVTISPESSVNPQSDLNRQIEYTQLQCNLIGGSIFDGAQSIHLDTNKIHRRSASEEDSSEAKLDCAHFERLEAKRMLTRQQVAAILKSLSDPTSGGYHVKQSSAISYSTSLICAAMIGLALGMIVNYLVALRKSPSRLTTSTS